MEYIYSLEKTKQLAHIRKKKCFLLRCVITSYLIAITLIKIGYLLYRVWKKGRKLVKQKHLLV